jgi:hypothetical protein
MPRRREGLGLFLRHGASIRPVGELRQRKSIPGSDFRTGKAIEMYSEKFPKPLTPWKDRDARPFEGRGLKSRLHPVTA